MIGRLAYLLTFINGNFSNEKGGTGTFYIPLVKNFFKCYYFNRLNGYSNIWAHLTTRYFEGSASFSPFGELTA
jgi:hypothetical protein